MSKWYQMKGAENDVALCTKVTLARNVKGYPFTIKLPLQQRKEIEQKVTQVLESELPGKFRCMHMSDYTQDQAISLAERNLVSPEFVSSAGGRSFLCTEDESLSIMLFEEDHLKIQGLLPGLELKKAYELADTLDTMLDEKLVFSYNDELGYLTQCPTNIGTAMRTSVFLHLPGLARSGQTGNLAMTVSKLGLILTGAYGEGASPRGDLYVLSNQVTLGITEKSAIDNLASICTSVIEQERKARAKLFADIRYEDKFYRALGTLENARILSFDELMDNISSIKLGLNDAPDTDIAADRINILMYTMQPATINSSKGLTLQREERDVLRAEQVRKVFSKKKE